MSWLWKDKKTEQLKTVLNQGFEEDRKNTTNKLTTIKKETNEFHNTVKEAFANSRITKSKITFQYQDWKCFSVHKNFEDRELSSRGQ